MKKADLEKIIDYINPSSLTYEEWLSVGMGMQYEGFTWQDFDAWSMRDSERYRAGEPERKWEGFSSTKDKTVTGGTIVQIAKEQGYSFPSVQRESGHALSWNSVIERENEFAFVDPAWVEGVSIEEPKNWNPREELARYLKELFEPNEYVGYLMKSSEEGKPFDKGVYYKTAGELIDSLQKKPQKGYEGLEWVTGDYNPNHGAWIRFNPLDGKGVKNENVTAFRYALLESDTMDCEKQLALIEKLQLPCKAIVFSGNKSVHAIIHIGAESYQEYRKSVEYLYEVCEANCFRLDKANKNPSRLSRMPGVTRGDKKQFLISTNTGKKTFNEWREWIEDVNDDMGNIEKLPEDNVRPTLSPELIEGILRTGHKMLVSGPSKAGKSFLLLQLGLAIAKGEPWLGHKCKQGNVLYVNLELDPKSCLARIYDILDESEQSFSDVRDHFMVWNLRGKAVPMDKLSRKLIRRTEELKIDAVIIDPIYKVLTGDENNAKDMADFANQFDKVATKMNCAVIYCHHHSKGYQGQKRSIDRSSGSGVFSRDPDAIMDLTELEVQPESRDEYGMAPLTTAWRIECILREFATPKPTDIFFEYPIHKLDAEGVLKNLMPEEEKPLWQRGIEKANDKKQKREEKKRDDFEMFFASYTSFHNCKRVPLKNYCENSKLSERSARRRLKKYDDYIVEGGFIYEKKAFEYFTKGVSDTDVS